MKLNTISILNNIMDSWQYHITSWMEHMIIFPYICIHGIVRCTNKWFILNCIHYHEDSNTYRKWTIVQNTISEWHDLDCKFIYCTEMHQTDLYLHDFLKLSCHVLWFMTWLAYFSRIIILQKLSVGSLEVPCILTLGISSICVLGTQLDLQEVDEV